MAEGDTGVRRDSVEAIARAFLRHDLLIERAARIASTATWIAGFPEFSTTACDRNAVKAAVWFQDAWCLEDASSAAEVGSRVMSRPPSEIERRKSADALAKSLRGIMSPPAIEAATRAVCEAGYRETKTPEAWVIIEATGLETFGPLWLWGEIARCTAEAKPISSLVAVWERQIEYGYWKRRINDAFRFAKSRDLAARRCAMLESFFIALRQQLDGSDRHSASS